MVREFLLRAIIWLLKFFRLYSIWNKKVKSSEFGEVIILKTSNCPLLSTKRMSEKAKSMKTYLG